MGQQIDSENDIIDRFTKKKELSGFLRVIIPLYLTYIVFALSVFFVFLPLQKKQFMDQKKDTILQLTDSVISLLSTLNSNITQGKASLEYAQNEAINHIRHLRYGPKGKDYFWIIDLHPFMILHPYHPDLEGKNLALFKDSAGNYPFMAMVEKVLQDGDGYVNYYWQWNDLPQKMIPKLSYVKEFTPWGWIIGTGIYSDDIDREMQLITEKFLLIFGGILIFILLLSVYISRQVFRMEKKKNLEKLRLKKLLELSQMTRQSMDTLTEFALEEAVNLTQSNMGYLAFLNEDRSVLSMYAWSKKNINKCKPTKRIWTYPLGDAGVLTKTVQSGKPLIVNDYANFDFSGKKELPDGHVKISRVMNVPIFDGDKMVILVGVGNKKTDYNGSDLGQLELLMDGMWKLLQKKKTEEDLRQSEERYRLLAENATDAIWILSLHDMKITYVSPAIKNLSGYPPSEYINLNMGEYMSPDSLKNVLDILARELDQESQTGIDPKRFKVFEIEMIKKDGTKIWAEVNASFLRDKTGQPDRVLGITRDIRHNIINKSPVWSKK